MNRSGHAATSHGDTQVSLLVLLDRYGAAHRAELEALWADAGTEHLVLFGDASGKERAILPVGSAHEYADLAEAFRLEIEGLRAICHTPALGALREAADRRPGDAWRRWHEAFPVLITKTTPPEDTVAAALGVVNEKLHELSRREADLAWREKHADTMERRLDALAQEHLVKLAELEQRACELDAAKREAERAAKATRPFDRVQPVSLDLPDFSSVKPR